MRWDRINVLIEKLQEDLVQQGYERAILKYLSINAGTGTSTLTRHRMRSCEPRQVWQGQIVWTTWIGRT